MAAVLCIALPWFVFTLQADKFATRPMRAGATGLLVLLTLQIFLGAQIIWTFRAAYVTTGHVVVGALTLVTTFWLTWLAHRDAIEGKSAT
jgi:cytochrome c oxidase assembly protein subunit 15